ncbi:hypothetical protein BCAR13_60147 [Paraburkholderia caribensis]|nr:hypothetical protein BCAR13_60147 [Paraburkholderia caribensis]
MRCINGLIVYRKRFKNLLSVNADYARKRLSSKPKRFQLQFAIRLVAAFITSLGRYQVEFCRRATFRRCCERTQDVLAVQRVSSRLKDVLVLRQLNT